MTTHTLAAGATLSGTTPGRVALLADAPHVLAWIVTLVALVGYIVLAAMHVTPPAVLDTVLGVSFGSASGLSWPLRATS